MIEDAMRAISARGEAMLERTARLVEVNSYTENRDGGNKVADMLCDAFAEIPGAKIDHVESSKYARHLVMTIGPQEGASAIVGHLDTVFPPGTFEGFRRDGDIARGPGVLDMKGGLVLAIEAVKACAVAGAFDARGVAFVIVSDEEIGSPEGASVIREHAKGCAAALVLESGRKEDRIITARKGTGGLKFVATGKAAHAGNAHKEGKNAIWALAKLVDELQKMTDYARGVTVNVGKFVGGTTKNTVPDRAEAWVDMRFEKIEDAERLRARMDDAALSCARAVEGTSIAIELGAGRLPLERTDANVALYREYAACAKAVGLGDGEAALVGGGSDASTTAAMGIPSIDGLGPRGSGFHTHDELIEVASLVPKSQAIARFLIGRSKG